MALWGSGVRIPSAPPAFAWSVAEDKGFRDDARRGGGPRRIGSAQGTKEKHIHVVMRIASFILTVLFLSAIAAAAETNSPTPPKASFQGVKTNAAQSWQDIKETLGASRDYTFAKKDEFIAKAKADLKALDAKIKELRKKSSHTSGETKTNAQEKLKNLHSQRDALEEKLKEAKAAGAEDWDKAKAGVTNGLEEVKDSVKDAWQWMSDKVNK